MSTRRATGFPVVRPESRSFAVTAVILLLLLLSPLVLGGCVRRAAAKGAPGRREAAGTRILEIDDIRLEMKKARGQVLFVHLWATWCGPCLEELPLIDGFARAARARGALVLSVSLDSDPRGVARVPETLQARAPSLTPVVARFADPEPFISLISPSWEGAIPALFAFDRGGKLRGSVIGEVEPAELYALLDRMSPPATPTPAPRTRAP